MAGNIDWGVQETFETRGRFDSIIPGKTSEEKGMGGWERLNDQR